MLQRFEDILAHCKQSQDVSGERMDIAKDAVQTETG
jgi:hypothetical protein